MSISTRHLQQILNDCLYALLYTRHQNDPDLEGRLFRAGNIEEIRSEIDERMIEDTRFLTLPVKISASGPSGKKQAVIVSTGSYSPVHAGHIEIMNIAREYVNSLGYEVLQGVLSASHDAYVSIKRGGQARMHVTERSRRIHQAIEGIDWLALDRFEGEGLGCAINFSTVLYRVRRYILANHPHARDDLTVFYVFGADNAGFAEAFVGQEQYQGICVGRGGYDLDALRQQYQGIQGVHCLAHDSDSAWYSSTEVRRQGFETKPSCQASTREVFLVRTDRVPATFASELAALISRYTKPGVTLRQISSSDFSVVPDGVISLDKFVRGEYTLDLSRLFELSGGQRRARGLIALGAALDEQVQAIPAGEYVLVDDDSVSGYTMDQAEALLARHGVRIKDRQTLIERVLAPSETLFDVVDARDFLIGAEKGGLVVDLFCTPVRALYAFPLVDVVSRASIRPEQALAFSREVWALNRTWAGHLTIEELPTEQAPLYRYLGQQTTVAELCDQYMAIIDNTLRDYASY